MIALADTYRIFDDNQHYILCLADAACAIMTMANGTYYMCVIFPSMREIISIFTHASSTVRCNTVWGHTI